MTFSLFNFVYFYVSLPKRFVCRTLKLSATDVTVSLFKIVSSFSSLATFNFFNDTQNVWLMTYGWLIMKIAVDLSFYNFSPSIPLSMSVSLPVVYGGIIVFISLLPWVIVICICKVSKSFNLATLTTVWWQTHQDVVTALMSMGLENCQVCYPCSLQSLAAKLQTVRVSNVICLWIPYIHLLFVCLSVVFSGFLSLLILCVQWCHWPCSASWSWSMSRLVNVKMEWVVYVLLPVFQRVEGTIYTHYSQSQLKVYFQIGISWSVAGGPSLQPSVSQSKSGTWILMVSKCCKASFIHVNCMWNWWSHLLFFIDLFSLISEQLSLQLSVKIKS